LIKFRIVGPWTDVLPVVRIKSYHSRIENLEAISANVPDLLRCAARFASNGKARLSYWIANIVENFHSPIARLISF
jgi:hypothetical protein